MDDIDLRHERAVIRRGKGGKGRVVPFGPQTARALDRYLRLRRAHRLAGTPALWLGERGRGFSYYGLRAGRAAVAGCSHVMWPSWEKTQARRQVPRIWTRTFEPSSAPGSHSGRKPFVRPREPSLAPSDSRQVFLPVPPQIYSRTPLIPSAQAVNILVREARATPSTYTRTTRQCLVVFQAT